MIYVRLSVEYLIDIPNRLDVFGFLCIFGFFIYAFLLFVIPNDRDASFKVINCKRC